MTQSPQVNQTGLGFLPILTLIFITLKLLKVITWSWWWVFVPIWGPLAALAVMTVIVLIVAFLVG